MLDGLKILAALGLAGFGLYAALRPHAAAALIHTSILDARGRAEMRVNLGGFFIGLGLAPLLLGDQAAYSAAGAAYLAAALARLASIVLDRPALDSTFWGVLAIEIASGLILIA